VSKVNLYSHFINVFVSDYDNDADVQSSFVYSDNNVEKICSVSGSYIVLATLAPNICRSLVWDLLTCHPYGVRNFDFSHTFLESLCTTFVV